MPTSALAPSLHVPAEGLLDLAARVALGEVVPLVVGLLALGQRERGLDLAVFEVQVERDEREPALLGLADELLDLGAVHEHLALATRSVVGPRALRVLGDVHMLQPHLAAVDGGEPVDQRGTAGPQALHLRAGEHQAHLVGVEDRVVVPRLLVLGDELAPLFPRHVLRLPRRRHPAQPLVATIRMRSLRVSAISSRPCGSKDTPRGLFRLAFAAGPPSPAKRRSPFPARVVMTPAARSTLRTRALAESAT